MGFWTRLERLPITRRIMIVYSPNPDDRARTDGAQTSEQEGISVTVSVLDPKTSRRYFGVPMARRGVQPVWVRIENRSKAVCRLQMVSIDPNYFSSYEAAALNHFRFAKRLVAFGALGFLFLPLLLLVPLKLISARRANQKMDEFFRSQAFPLRNIGPGAVSEGFVFTRLDVGSKIVRPRILRIEGPLEFSFNFQVAGIDPDYEKKKDFADTYSADQLVECDQPALFERLKGMPCAVTNADGSRRGDPANLVVIGEFETLLNAFCGRWDETETITLSTCWKTFRAFLMGTEYRYSPVSPLYLFGRSQDFALQRVRESINERLHLRLWLTELRCGGKPVWFGQISRDIGVRFTLKTWNLTTHRIDPNVDEARDYVLEDLLEAEHLEQVGYVSGVGACAEDAARRNLTGDPYFTDGNRGVAFVSAGPSATRFIVNKEISQPSGCDEVI
jgi:hypothetical protein